MTLFFLNLRSADNAPKVIATCTIVGERQGFSSREREFDDVGSATQVLEAVGVERSRLEYVFGRTYGHWATALELTATQAQLLDVLRPDNSEQVRTSS